MVSLTQLDMPGVDGPAPIPSEDMKKMSTPATDAPRRSDTSWFSRLGWLPIMYAMRVSLHENSQQEQR